MSKSEKPTKKSLVNIDVKKRKTYKREELIDSLIYMRLKKNMSRFSLMNFLKDELGYKQTQVYAYIKEVTERISRMKIQEYILDMEEDIQRWEQELEKCELNKDRRGARECLREIGKLKGHYIERHELNIDTIIRADFNLPDDKE